MKVYKIKESGEISHFCFNGCKKEALEWYINETMCDESDITSLVVFPRKNWKNIQIKYDEDNLILTIEEFMKGQVANEVICSTAYL